MSQTIRLLKGVVSDLEVREGEQELFAHTSGHRIAGVGAAAGLATAGLAGAAVGASIAATSSADAVEIFNCKVDGEPVTGQFSKVTFKNGDELEVVQHLHAGTGTIVAARRKADQVLWMRPHCSRGVLAHRVFAVRMSGWIFLSGMAVIGTMFSVFQWRSARDFSWDFTLFWLSIVGLFSLIASLYYSIRFYRQWLPAARFAEMIIEKLAYRDPSRVDLERDHKSYCRANGIKWPYNSDGPWVYRYQERSSRIG